MLHVGVYLYSIFLPKFEMFQTRLKLMENLFIFYEKNKMTFQLRFV